jgi:hypothetical protein
LWLSRSVGEAFMAHRHRALYAVRRGSYISRAFANSWLTMRTETERTINQIKQSLALLRRHL